jgi:diguanylate cyclase (GGDEF)-like protein/PAS domain S-box-containing protein
VSNTADRRFGRRAEAATESRSGSFEWLRGALRPGAERPGVSALDPERATRLIELFEGGGKGWFWETDRDGRLVYLSRRVAERLKLDGNKLLGSPFADLLAPDEESKVEGSERSLRFYLSSRAPFSDLIVKAKAKEEIWWSVSGQPITDGYGRFFGFRGLATDLTEHRRSEVELNRLARFDTLTGLANRAMMRRVLEDALLTANLRRHRCAVFLLDLDRFKAVNDTLGHPVGDTLLKLVALRLQTVIGETGQIGRLGGDEFKAVFPNFSDEEFLADVAQRLIEHISEPYTIGGNIVSIGTSVGIVVSDYDDRTPDDLIRDADLALYAAKAAGKGCFRFFAPDMHAEARERQQLEADLRRAIAEDGLSLTYQPSVHLGSEEVVGFEALVRWHHPTKGWISPVQFIPLAEETGLIGALGDWVLRTACAQAAQWPKHIKVAVNLSPAQVIPTLPGTVAALLSDCALPADRLELEITEGLLLNDDATVRETISRLKKLGVRLALDDFGTGYSSLGYLLKVPFDKIKIDRSFVCGASLKDTPNAAIIRAVVGLARELNMETTAEGVETHDELTLVRELGCSLVQGFIYGKPMPAEEAGKLITTAGSVTADGFVKARQERRRLLRFGTLSHGNRTYKVKLRNVSSGGARIECQAALAPGSEVMLDIASGEVLAAVVKWHHDGHLGLQFMEPIDLSLLAHATGRSRAA